MEELTVKDQKEIKKGLRLETDYDYSTRILAVAEADDGCLNENLRIPTSRGTPLCNEVHDLVRDCYYALGVSWHDIGEIPISIRATMPGVSGWEADLPVPPEMLEQYFSEEQKRLLEDWKERYVVGYRIKYLQLRSIY